MKKVIITIFALLLLPSVLGLYVGAYYNEYYTNTTTHKPITFYFMAEDQYKQQRIDFYINASNTTFLNKEYMNYTKSFYIKNNAIYMLKIDFYDYYNETQTINWGINTINTSINNQISITTIGNNKKFNLTELTTSIKDMDKRYGYYQNKTELKNKCLEQNKKRKYPIQC